MEAQTGARLALRQHTPTSKTGLIFFSWQRDLVILTELIVLEHMFGCQGLIATIVSAIGRIFQPVGVVTARPAVKNYACACTNRFYPSRLFFSHPDAVLLVRYRQ